MAGLPTLSRAGVSLKRLSRGVLIHFNNDSIHFIIGGWRYDS